MKNCSFLVFCLAAVLFLLSGCSNVQQGTAQALDNAGSATKSVIESSKTKVWIPKDGSGESSEAPVAESEEEEEEEYGLR